MSYWTTASFWAINRCHIPAGIESHFLAIDRHPCLLQCWYEDRNYCNYIGQFSVTALGKRTFSLNNFRVSFFSTSECRFMGAIYLYNHIWLSMNHFSKVLLMSYMLTFVCSPTTTYPFVDTGNTNCQRKLQANYYII